MVSTTYVKSCFGSCHIHHGSRHVHPQSAWVFGVPGCLTIEYESGKRTRQVRGRVPGANREEWIRSNPRSGWDRGEVSTYPVARRTQGFSLLQVPVAHALLRAVSRLSRHLQPGPGFLTPETFPQGIVRRFSRLALDTGRHCERLFTLGGLTYL
jgi:hypothetical protein